MRRPAILVVEDDHLIATNLQETLVNFGYKFVLSVTTAQEALEWAQMLRPDLVLMDIHLSSRPRLTENEATEAEGSERDGTPLDGTPLDGTPLDGTDVAVIMRERWGLGVVYLT